ncbi:putative 5-formyltetrahydrofolate cyclo-ligase [Candidatus Terasakiella magnetica]|uniref:5-formyltetrahydrofolate cyclo-ligase n=1 Tax=Candidatus Terasakiella magnetica TaxID=1867952 RepID=A0A1C3RHN6_9PROT|nr:5-formyltetrahydrofolate cyclo-ligase [Candidatus Terasakiella magnetica]SCA56791.1 putative 5-formyltetrahydrofolate cyclo-ligase [Candidatus Terasakiella magnetica]
MLDLDDQKAQLRTKMLFKRKSISLSGQDVRLKETFFSTDLFTDYKKVAAYWPMAGELDVRALLHALSAEGRTCALPIVKKKHAPLVFLHWQTGDVLIKGAHGTQQPEPSVAELIPDLALVPLLGFDQKGGRLGFGGGYYDRTLEAYPQIKTIGVAFDEQEVDHIPMDVFDQKMDWILTPTRVIEIQEES